MEDDGMQDLNVFIDIARDCAIKTLINGGILVELDGGVGFNGVTTPKGLSSAMFDEVFSDLLNYRVVEMLAESLSDALEV